MTSPFEGVLMMPKRKHLLVSCRLKRTACDNAMKTGKVYEGTDLWNGYAPVQCPKCAEKWQEWKEGSKQ